MAPRCPGPGPSARDALLSGSYEALSDADVVGVLLGEEGAGELAGAFLAEHPIPDMLWRVRGEDLVRLPGIGPAAAARMLAGLELSRRAACWRAGEHPVVSGPEDVVGLCALQFRGVDREHFWALALNTKNRLLRMVEVSVGSLSASIVHPRELFRDAVRVSAASIVVVNNHPSGDPTPSGADIQLTRRLQKAGDVLGIEVLDHVVIGDGGAHTSMRDAGLM